MWDPFFLRPPVDVCVNPPCSPLSLCQVCSLDALLTAVGLLVFRVAAILVPGPPFSAVTCRSNVFSSPQTQGRPCGTFDGVPSPLSRL